MIIFRTILFFVAISMLLLPLAADELLIDGKTGDWPLKAKVYQDKIGDADSGGIDFGGLWIANDADRVYLRLDVGIEIGIQNVNSLTLYIDGDADASTDLEVCGLGAELEWFIGMREGQLFFDGKSRDIQHQDIGLVTSPSVTSTIFEFALNRNAMLEDGKALFSGQEFRVAFTTGVKGGDFLPDKDEGVSYAFDKVLLPSTTPISLEKQDPSHLRILSYNINSHLIEPHRVDAYRRIVQAIAPDIMLWEEVYGVSKTEAVEYIVENIMPEARNWHSAKTGGEEVLLLSSGPIISFHPLGKSAAFLLDMTSKGVQQMLLVGLSLPCCSEHENRQREIDSITAFVREAKAPGGTIDIKPGTPIIYMGDANLVGPGSQRISLIQGSIKNVSEFGKPHFPDWNGTPLTDLTPRHTHSRMTFTWYGNGYTPGRLDYVFYSKSVLGIGNRFVLFTPEIPTEELKAYRLSTNDTLTGSHHQPVVADFILNTSQ